MPKETCKRQFCKMLLSQLLLMKQRVGMVVKVKSEIKRNLHARGISFSVLLMFGCIDPKKFVTGEIIVLDDQ